MQHLPVSLHNIIKYSYKEPQSQTKAPFCVTALLKNLLLKIERRLKVDELEAVKLPLLLPVCRRHLSYVEPQQTVPFCLIPTRQSLTFSSAWDGPTQSGFDCRWCSWNDIQEQNV